MTSREIAPRSCRVCHYPSWTYEIDRRDDETEVIVDSYSSLHKSADEGCDGCTLLREAWRYGASRSDKVYEGELVFNRRPHELYVHLFQGGRVHNLEIFTLPNQPRLKHVRQASLLPPTTHLSDNLSRIQGWINACIRMHQKCNSPNSYVPVRLLQLDGDNIEHIRLVENLKPTATNFKYACLSHCWGETRSKYLTKRSNLSLNKSNIPVPELPSTFRDAISVSRSLGITFLWIDSLCIVQDDSADWKFHVEEMAKIYENAFITLAAGASVDDDGGFFSTLPENCLKPHHLPLRIDGQDYSFYFRYCVDHPDAGWPARETLPLMQRGWCLQERLLSRRFLCFGSKEILWECLEDVSCSCSVAGGPFGSDPFIRGFPRFPDCVATKHTFAQISDSPHNVGLLWHTIVGEFTRRRLAFQSDKLPALAGLAKRYQDARRTYYIFGLWRESLRSDLAWQVEVHSSVPVLCPPPGRFVSGAGRPRRAPSWSWVAAADGAVHWRVIDNINSDFYDVLNVPSTGPEREEENMSIELSGILLPVSLQCWEERNDIEQAYPLMRSCRVRQWSRRHSESEQLELHRFRQLVAPLPGSSDFNPEVKRTRDLEQGLREDKYGEYSADYRFWHDESDLRTVLQHAHFFLLGTEWNSSRNQGWGVEYRWVEGLLLKPLAGHFDGPVKRYERIGWLRYCTRQRREDWKPSGIRTKFFLM